MKIIIAGSRSFYDYKRLKLECDNILIKYNEPIEIVSGHANGADKLGEKYAKENNYFLTLFYADWNQYGKSAGYIRNEEMAKYSNILISFWDGISKGTYHMINLAKKYNLKFFIFRF